MKKYLMLFLILFVSLFMACEDDNPVEEHPFTEVDAISAEHQYKVSQDEVSPYVVVESVLDENKNLIYSLTYISIFPNTMLENGENISITGRYYDYYQVDYETISGGYHKYFHQYDYLDSTERSYAQNFMPYFNFKEQLKSLSVLVKYHFDRDGQTINKEIKFKETILQFNLNEFFDEIEKYSFDVFKTKNENEDFNRYKLGINLDESISKGHYDIQTWVEIDGEIYPFVGYYHYRPNHGNIYTGSDIKVSTVHQIEKIYLMIVHYSENNEVNYIYYRKGL